MWTASKEKFLKELNKCQLLCKACHMKKTLKEIQKPITHGKIGSYTRRKCRCKLCTFAMSDYIANRRKKYGRESRKK